MKTLGLFIALFITDPATAQDSTQTDMTWLVKEMAQEQELPDCSFLPCAKSYYVNAEGDIMLVVDQVTTENNLLIESDADITRRSDFMFESNTGDRFYLVN